MKAARRYIIMLCMFILIVLYVIYRIPYRMTGEYTVYNEYGEPFIATVSLQWNRYLLAPDAISGTIIFNEKIYYSLDLLAKRWRISYGNMGAMSRLSDKWNGVIVSPPLISAGDFDEWLHGCEEISIAPPYQMFKQGIVTFIFRDKEDNASVFSSNATLI